MTNFTTIPRDLEGLHLKHRLDLQFNAMMLERASFDSHWKELNDNILPRRGRFFVSDANKGNRRTKSIIDSTATLSARTAAAGIMTGVTSPARPWFRFTTPDPDMAEFPDVKEWLRIVEDRMRTVFLRSNLYQNLPIIYKDIVTFGTGALFIEEDFSDTIRTYPFPIGSYYMANDDKLRVDVFGRQFRMTVRQLVNMFGQLDPTTSDIDWSNFSTLVKTNWEARHRETWVDVRHIIVPNDNYDASKAGPQFKKYISAYYERGSTTHAQVDIFASDQTKILRLSGFDQFPVMVPRWEITGEDVYGTDCPGMTALGDVKQLNLGEKRIMQAIEKMVSPPMTGPPSLKTSTPSILPGSVTYANVMQGQQGFRPVYQVDPRIQEMDVKQNQVRSRIRRAFYEDLFLMLASSDRREITAREVEERHEEKLLALGSVLERINQDLLDPLIDLTFEIMVRQGQIPPPPEIMMGMPLKVEYISIMAQAQKLTGLVGLERFAGMVANLATLDPAAMDKLDRDQLIDAYGEVVGVPSNIIVSDEDVAIIRQQRAQQQQQQAAQEAILNASQSAKNLGQAKIEEDNVLGQLAEAAGGGVS